MKKPLLIGAVAMVLGLAALQASPSIRVLPGDEEEIDEPESVPATVEEEAEEREVRPVAPKAAAPKGNDEAEKVEAVQATTAAPVNPVTAGPAVGPAISMAQKPVEERNSSLTPMKVNLPEPPKGGSTPMAQRTAVIGLLNKRNGLWRDLVMKPGEARRIGDVVVRLRACEKSADWEHERLTGAFVQLLVNDTDKKWRRYFSGWLYKESPSLNVVEHPVYDVWAKECLMRHSDVGPNTTIVRGGEAPKERKGDEEEG